MTKKPTTATVEVTDPDAAPAEGGDAAPPDNIGRLRTHLKTDSLALKLLGAWSAAGPQTAKPTLLKAIDDHFSEKK